MLSVLATAFAILIGGTAIWFVAMTAAWWRSLTRPEAVAGTLLSACLVLLTALLATLAWVTA